MRARTSNPSRRGGRAHVEVDVGRDPSGREGLEGAHVGPGLARAPRGRRARAMTKGSPTDAVRGGCARVSTSSGRSESGRRDLGHRERLSERQRLRGGELARDRAAVAFGDRDGDQARLLLEGHLEGNRRDLRALRSPPARRPCPTLGWPAKGISFVGVKIRTRRVCPASAGSTKVLSEKLNSRAICCIRRLERPRASGRTASGLPPKRRSVKTSHEDEPVAHASGFRRADSRRSGRPTSPGARSRGSTPRDRGP